MSLLFLGTVEGERHHNVNYIRMNPRESMSSNQSLIRDRFRFNDTQMDWITEQLSPLLGDDTNQPWALSKRRQVDAGIRYLRTNSLQVDISDTVTCCQKTVSNTVTRVVEALNDPDVLRRFIIFKPDDPEWCRRRADEFARIGLLSNVVGCIDGTLLPIWTPSKDGFQYVSRKGYSCLNVCLISDAVGRILYVNAAFPGSVHDSYVWNNCAAGHMFRDGRVVSGYQLLGDCGYANGRGIMTPYRPTSVRGDQRKRRFNREHCRMRSTVERTICTWKRRFRILNDLRLDPDFAVKAVIACAVLHNMGYCINATNMRLLGRRKARVMHPPDDVVDIRAFVTENL